MNQEFNIRHFFPGGNTTLGFHSFFDHILHHEEANHFYSLKGGPGTGKSSLMKKVGEYYGKKGYDIEYHHCSSDPDSLDAVVIPKLKVALVDGTAPHIVDPKTPGAIDEIINLGDNWDQNKLKERKDEILRVRTENSRLFQKAYGYLKSAGALYDICDKTALSAFNLEKATVDVNQLIDRILGSYPFKNTHGKRRDLFAFGITPQGIVNYRKDYVDNMTVKVVIKEDLYSSSQQIMDLLADQIKKRGFSLICLHSPLKVGKLLEIIVDEIGLVISVDHPYYSVESSINYNYELDLTKFIDNNQKERIQNEVNDDVIEFNHLLEKAISFVKKAHENHDLLERYYIDALDFSKHEMIFDRMIKQMDHYL